jgi:hypothetical protein
VDAIANHVQKEYTGGSWTQDCIKELSLPMILISTYPTVKSGGQSTQEMCPCGNKTTKKRKPRRITLLIENKKCVYALVLEECSTKLDSKIKGSDKYI